MFTSLVRNNVPTFFHNSFKPAALLPVSFRFFNNPCQIHVPQLLHKVVKDFDLCNQTNPFDGVFLTSVQDMLSTTVDMFSVLKYLGLKEAIVAGKSFSMNEESVNRFQKLGYEFIPENGQLGYGRFNDAMREATFHVWDRSFQKIRDKKPGLLITLDDGADLLLTVPAKLFNQCANKPHAVIGIEQASVGSNFSLLQCLPFPIIDVAGSFLKTTIEAPWVAKIIFNKVVKLVEKSIKPHLSKEPVIGILSNGTMGRALIKKFADAGFTVIFYDKDKEKSHSTLAEFFPEAALVVRNADIIVGATGTDVTANESILNAFLYSMQNKWLISAGSDDIEFNKLLEVIQNKTKQPGQTPNPLEDIEFRGNDKRGTLTILRGGFPINFDNKPHSVPPEGIWPTRAALLLATLMCTHLYQNKHPLLHSTKILKLDPQGQLAIIREYQKYQSLDPSLDSFVKLNDEDALAYIKQHSEGEEVEINVNKRLKCGL